MKVKIIKPWPVGGYVHRKIGTFLEVDREVAIPAIYAGYVEDITGRIVRPEPEEPQEPEPVKKTKTVTKIKERE